VIALIRYQAAMLLRGHRWIGPLLTYAVLLTFIGAGASQPLAAAVGWSAGMLVPAVAWLTRSALTAEPPAARACVAAAGGPHRAHVAALLAALAGGVILALAGEAYELATSLLPRHHAAGGGLTAVDPGAVAGVLAAGLASAAVCLLVGSAIGVLCGPPLVRHHGYGILATIGAVVLALVTSISPANAALRGSGGTLAGAPWLTGLPLLAALALTAVSWLASALLAARRG
jgi:hypothetical protein